MTGRPIEVRAGLGVPTQDFRRARDVLFEHRSDYEAARADFQWPHPAEFNWALDWFDVIAADPVRGEQPALRVLRLDCDEIVGDDELTFAQLAERSNRAANWLRGLGVRRDDRILVMLGSQIPLWETLLAGMKLGAVMVPSPRQLSPGDVADRVARAEVRHVIVAEPELGKFDGVAGLRNRIVVRTDGHQAHPAATAGPGSGHRWHDFAEVDGAPSDFRPDGVTRIEDLLLLYFTSGSTARPKLVHHSHGSWPIGQLTTMYAIGLQPGDRHVNISSPGWAKHSCSALFAPWSAEACVVALDQPRFSARGLLTALVHSQASTFCAPPTVWRMLLQEDLTSWPIAVRDAVSAGEPLNSTIIDRIRRDWKLTVRDAYGQTEATGLVGNSPGQRLVPGSMGRPLPGYRIVLRDPETGQHGDIGEICVDLDDRPLGLTPGYLGEDGQLALTVRDGLYLTGDVAERDPAGHLTFLGRRDELFKSSDYRVSPFEIESVLLEHDAVAEVAVTPYPDQLRLAVPKAYVALAAGWLPDDETSQSILSFARSRLAPYKRPRRVEFTTLPRTTTGKIIRTELRAKDEGRLGSSATRPSEFREATSLHRGDL